MLADIGQGRLLLLIQRRGTYDLACHNSTEHIVAQDGEVGIMSDGGEALWARQGEMAVMPDGLRHRYHESSNGTVAVVFGGVPENLE